MPKSRQHPIHVRMTGWPHTFPARHILFRLRPMGCIIVFLLHLRQLNKHDQLKKLSVYLLYLQAFLLWSSSVFAQFQPAEVIRTQEKTILNGKVFYIHTVQKGQTFYSICKAYGATQEDVLKANPQLDPASLKEGLVIRIPETGVRQAAVYPDNREDFHAHIVRKGQTVYALSKKFNVSEEIIYHYNPWAREGLKTDQTVWIPRKKELQVISETPGNSDYFFYYTVKEKDTLYSISRLYGVNVADIMDANPFLREGLKAGQVLMIPRMSTPEPDIAEQADSLEDLSVPCLPSAHPETFDVALLLPFFAEFSMEEVTLPTDTMLEEGTYVPPQRQQGLRGRNFAEFYEGFMLAVDSLKSTGLSVNLHVKDTERDTLRIKKIVRELSVLQPDLIIGPVYSEDVSITGRLARYQEVSLISPLSTRHPLVAENPNILQIIPSRQAEGIALANYISTFTKGDIILVRGTDSVSMSNSWRFKKQLQDHMPLDSLGRPLGLREYWLKDSLMTVLDRVLNRDKQNLVVIYSESEPDVSRLVTRLNLLSSLYSMQVFGLSSWQSWKTIDLNYFHQLQTCLITPFYTDYSHPAVRRFLLRSRDAYGYEPDGITPLGYNFSMLGYDIGFFFLSALKQYGKDFRNCLDQVQADQLLTRFRFSREGNGGLVNTSFVLIRYKNDYTVERLTWLNGASTY